MSSRQNPRNRQDRTRLFARLGLALLLASQMGLALDWLSKDRTPAFWDHASHGRAALKSGHAIWRDTPPLRGRVLPQAIKEEAIAHPTLARSILGPIAGPANWIEAFYRHASYPSLPFMVSGLLLPITGNSPDGLALTLGTLWLLAAILATYLLAAQAYGEGIGLVAATSLAGMPLALGLGRSLMVDEALIATTAAAAWLLIRSRGFCDKPSSLLLGLALGLGLLAKQTFIIVMGPALLWEAAGIWRAHRLNEPGSAPRWRNLGLALLVTAFVAAPWYVAYLPSMLSDPLRFGLVLDTLRGESTGSFSDPWIYPRTLLASSMGPFALGFAILGSIFLVLKGQPRGTRALLFGSAAALLFYTLAYPNKGGRFIAAILPIAALAVAALVHALPSRTLRLSFGCIVVALSILTTIGTTVTDLGEPEFAIPFMEGRSRWLSLREDRAHPPESADWGHTQVLEAIRADHGSGQAQVLILQQGADYHGELMLRVTPGQMSVKDGHATDSFHITKETRELERRQPYHLVVALQHPDSTQTKPSHDFEWIAVHERRVLEQTHDFVKILELNDLPHDMTVTVYRNKEGAP